MEQDELATLLSEVVLIARQAARIILEVYQLSDDYGTQYKTDQSPVTIADTKADQLICESLKQLTPTLPILSEEGEVAPFVERSQWDKYWLIDPLDGTKEFISGTDNFTVNIALMDKNVPILGVVAAPKLDRVYWAIKGGKAYCQQGSYEAQVIRVSKPEDPLRIIVSRSHGSAAKLQNLLNLLGPHEIITCGSTLKICLVASGKADLYPRFGQTSEWDLAAGQCILEAAGGQLVDLQLDPISYNSRDSLINPEFVALSYLDIVEDIELTAI